MTKNIKITDDLYNRIKILAEKKNMKISDLLDTLVDNIYEGNENRILLNDYEEFANIMIENTGLFDYKGGQSGVYNRIKESKVDTLQDLFRSHDLKKIDYGVKKLNDNNFLHNEIDGIISLLRYKYLNENNDVLTNCLNSEINGYYTVGVSNYPTGFPGEIFKAVIRRSYPKSIAYESANEMFFLFKSCGFNLTCTKALMDYAFAKKVKDITLGEFLLSIDLNEIKFLFSKVKNDYDVFVNLYNILTSYYKNICEERIK